MLTLADAIISCGIAAITVAVMGPFVIPLLARLKAGQVVRDDGPKRHLGKAGTPTMGGIMIISGLIVGSLTMGSKSKELVWCLAATVTFGVIGFVDDYIKVVLKRSLGLRAREKLAMQIFFGLIFSIYLVYGLYRGTDVLLPFSSRSWELGFYYFPFIILVFVATTNAVNLTDGLDGLAAGVTAMVSLGFAAIAVMTSRPGVLIFSLALTGACLGFLIFNRYPARVFMGDTGSMALGAAVASMAALTRSEIALLLLGGVYVLEALSVMIQVASFQTTGKRIFLMSPLHHHFELMGWHETKVVRLFYLVSLLFVILGLLGLRGLGG